MDFLLTCRCIIPWEDNSNLQGNQTPGRLKMLNNSLILIKIENTLNTLISGSGRFKLRERIKNWSSKILLNCPFKRHRFTKNSLKRVLLHIASVFCQIWIRDRKLGSGSDYFFVKNNLVKEVAQIC